MRWPAMPVTPPVPGDLKLAEAGGADPAGEELKALLAESTGNFRLSGPNSPVLEKVRQRLARNGLDTVADYLDLLKRGEIGRRELDSLIAELTVGETFFFRHPDHFDAFRDHVLPAVLERNRASRQLRIWSAGCANGAETYSIAILVRSLLGDRIEDWVVSIVGSDVNRAFLAEAEDATFNEWSLRGVPGDQRPGWFERAGRAWRLRPRYRENVRFVYHNIISEPIPSLHKGLFGFDIVFCRNVMIYFADAVNQRLVAQLDHVLVEAGWLFVGPADFNPHLDATFETARPGGTIVFRKRRPQPAAHLSVVSETAADAGQRRRPSFPGPAGRSRPPTSSRRPPAHEHRHANAGGDTPQDTPQDTPESGLTDSAEALLERVVGLANRGEWEAAAAQCEAALDADGFNATAHYYHALVLQSVGEAAAAEKALRRSVYLERGFALAHYQLGLCLKQSGDRAGCTRSLRNVLAALAGLPDDRNVAPYDRLTALELRELTALQLDIVEPRQ